MGSMSSVMTHKGVVGEKLRNDSYGDAKREFISKIEANIRDIQLLIDSSQLSASERALHFQALDALYSARETIESIALMLNS